MNAPNSTYERVRRFLERELWEIETVDMRWWKRFLLHQGQVWVVVLRDFFTDHCLLRASALTFTTLLSIVPLLALMFSVLKAFGVQNELQPMLLEHLAVGSNDVVQQIITYINNTNVGRLGMIGLVLLVITVLTLLSNIEKTFNSIWGVEETRPLLRRFSDYFSVVTIGPVFVVAAISMTSSLQSQNLVQRLLEQAYIGELLLLLFKILPFMVMWLVFAGLYLFMPNVKVSLRAALVGGIIGGTLWQLGQWGYVHFQFGVARYNAIYGTMAALPIFMVWIYFSWMIVLFGLEMTYATQNLRSIRQDIRGTKINFTSREFIALTVLVFLGRRFQSGSKAATHEQISTALEIPPRLLHTILDELQRLGLIVAVALEDEESGYQPAQALDRLQVARVVRDLAADGEDYHQLKNTAERRVVRGLAERLEGAEKEALEGVSLLTLVDEAENAEDQPEEAGQPS